MNSIHKRLSLCVFLLLTVAGCCLLALPAITAIHAEDAKAVRYICPMHPDVVSDKPGACSRCGMNLEKESGGSSNRNVAILIFDGVQIIDYTAPYEILGQQHLNVYTVAEKAEPITTSMNMKVTPAYSFENAPPPFILVIPGGDTDQAVANPRIITWIQENAQRAEHVLSVCNGAFFLAKAGLLDGLTATTFHNLIPELQAAAPRTKVIRDRKYVDNGKIITSAGLSSGIEGSLYLVSKIYGMDRALELALHLEYNWQPDSPYARANLADKYIQDLDLHNDRVSDWHPTRNLGGMDNWIIQGDVRSEIPPGDLLALVQQNLLKNKKWSVTSTKGASSDLAFSDEKGRPWKASLSVEPVAGEANRFTLTLKIDRSESQANANRS